MNNDAIAAHLSAICLVVIGVLAFHSHQTKECSFTYLGVDCLTFYSLKGVSAFLKEYPFK
jgi:hypothetical protein